MTTWRMSILGLMCVVVPCAVWSVWLIRPTFHAASFAFTTALTILLIALLQLRYGRDRAFWFGFVVFGWGYALLAFAPGSWTQIRPYLITSHPLGDLASALGFPGRGGAIEFNFNDLNDSPTMTIRKAGLNPWFATIEGDRFQRIGHSLAAILHGVAGGLLAVFLAARRRAADDRLAPG